MDIGLVEGRRLSTADALPHSFFFFRGNLTDIFWTGGFPTEQACSNCERKSYPTSSCYEKTLRGRGRGDMFCMKGGRAKTHIKINS
jgi:hypothetical protein